MEWQMAIGLGMWCFIAGMIIGGRIERNDAPRAKTLDLVFGKAIHDIAQFETFAGVPAVNFAVVRDEKGRCWRITIEREREEV